MVSPAPITSFDDIVRTTSLAAGLRSCLLTEDWRVIGGPINGGLVQALLVGAMRDELGGRFRDPVSSTAHFLSPAEPGRGVISVDVAQTGGQHATVSARFLQGSQERARAVATFGRLDAAVGPTDLRMNPPLLPPPGSCVTIPDEELPPFLRRFDLRFAPKSIDGFLGEPHGDASISAWLRFADGRAQDTLSLVMAADALPPAVLNVVDTAWVPTLALTVHVRAVPQPGWLRAKFTTGALIDGYLEEDGEIWDSSDRLVALSRQLARTRRRTADGSRITATAYDRQSSRRAAAPTPTDDAEAAQ